MNSKTFKRIVTIFVMGTLMACGSAQAVTINLFDWGFNIDGTTYCDAGPCDNDGLNPATELPASVDISGFDFTTGLGDITITIKTSGSHFIGLFLDIEQTDQATNTFFDEFGAASGSPSAGQSWEIDEPGLLFGDIFDNFLASALDNSNGVPAGSEEDVSMALAWNFSLAADETAKIDYVVNQTLPTAFHLSHTDPESNTTLYFSSSLNITLNGGGQIPEPTMLWLMGAGLGALGALRRRDARHVR